ncbi:hypothetical protein J3E69DRAFT_321075 [Trichoderma sp. SZMC 28015]
MMPTFDSFIAFSSPFFCLFSSFFFVKTHCGSIDTGTYIPLNASKGQNPCPYQEYETQQAYTPLPQTILFSLFTKCW